MVNAAEIRSRCAVLLLAALVLTAAAWFRGAEYDEQYTLFLTAGTARPDWPQTVFPAGSVAAMQAGHATLAGIARDLRATDVHPPLYFWIVSVWRDIFGPGLFAARMLSVLCGMVSLGMVGIIARRCSIPPAGAMLFTLGCYGFVYTNVIARGFAPAMMLTMTGVALLIGRRAILAGLCLGAACCCNYLAVFVAAAAIVTTGAWPAAIAAIPFLALDAWFFAAQHGARTGQFPPFEIWPSLQRLAEYQTASIFGGLPLYLDVTGRTVVSAFLGCLTIGLVVLVAVSLNNRPAIRMLTAAAVAPLLGLLMLGAVFDNTPIELRYLSFGLPFIGLLVVASSTEGGRGRWRPAIMPLILTIQVASIAGLLFSQRTMQPAQITATEAARLVGDGVVILPRGNDGVGIVGAFGIEAPPALPLLLVSPMDSFMDRIAPNHRIVLALLGQDRDSIATISILRAAFTAQNWRRVAIGSNLEVYERTDKAE